MTQSPPPDLRRRRFLQHGVYGGGALLLPAWLGGCGASERGAPPTTPEPPVTPPVTPPAAKFAPRGRHLSWTSDPLRSRTATWFTDGEDAPRSYIEFGPVSEGMSAAEIAGAPFPGRAEAATTATPGVASFTHKATASGLNPALPMRYRVGSEEGWSPVRVVRPTPAGEEFRFCHFGDHGIGASSSAVLRAVAARQPDFALLAGDISYANGEQPLWDDYVNAIEADYAASGILMTAPGNHEEEDNNGQTYRNRFACPSSTQSPDGTFYSFDLGRCHFVISTGGCFATDGTLVSELAFLEADLAQAALRRAAGEIDFIIVSQHFTLWTDNEGRNPANFTLVLLQENIFVRYGVDLLAVGHDHIYQRSKPMSFGLPNPLGYTQVTAGTGGKSFYVLLPQSGWSAAALQDTHVFVEYTVSRSEIKATTWAVDPLSGATAVADTFSIPRRSLLAANQAVQPVRSVAALGRPIDGNFDLLARRTQVANRLKRAHCAALDHA
ncbi:MAG: metallophosphoesterase family protein [Nevskiaceae bacterium]|nr:MAG: metallophosphoesterase family protein [Nevskiaceae bacterium]